MINKYSMYDQALKSGAENPVYQQELSAPAQDDVNWFSDAFSKIGSEANVGDKIIDKIQSASNDLKLKREKLDEQFKTGNASDDFTSMVETSHQVSQYGFQTALMAKLISKSTQSIEKLTNIQ
ncbi:hypothetical protein TDB9533_00045 [Thalassocella blandensis]|nr:hypothetical protein TDB9533_00045 [Thalassocella blandensis]